MRGGGALSALVVGLCAAVAATPATAAPEPIPYENAGKRYRNVMPPGADGVVNSVELAAFLAGGTRPEHYDDQLGMYSDIVHDAPGVKRSELDRYYKDGSFGVRPGDADRTYSPRDDVTIVRDKSFGVPHIYGQTRSGAMFGAGYVAAEDRLFMIDVLRHVGRSELSSFAGGSEGNRAVDRAQWLATPYTEEELRRQYELADEVYGATGAQLQRDLENYVDGINAYIHEARLNPLKMPGEYAAILRPLGPDDWKPTDVIATASLVAGIFGKGGGGELASALILQSAKERFGKRAGRRVWADFRSADDPEAPLTVHKRDFPYQDGKVDKRSRALPDRGSVQPHEVVVASEGSGARQTASEALTTALGLEDESPPLDGLFRRPKDQSSNALLVSAEESASGRPLAVFGPQVGYWSPEILMEQDIHAPRSADGPAIAARGSSFPGTNVVVQLGRGDGYAWSATSAGQDITDTFAVELCEPGGGTPSLESMHYRYRGECRPIEVLEKTNAWLPTPADQTPPGSETLRAERTALGIVIARATIGGKPVAYTQLRTTYGHEVDSAIGFVKFNDPDAINGPRDYQRAAHRIDYTFNWFYIDRKHIAYFNSGDNPVRPKGADPNLPLRSDYEWRDYNPSMVEPEGRTERQAPFKRHPQVIDQSFISSWNNKQAEDYHAADNNLSFGPVHRSQSLDERVRRGIRGKREMSVVELVNAVEDAATVDLRATQVLPLALEVIGRGGGSDTRAAVRTLRKWVRDGGHRRDEDGDGRYEHREAIAILDAWWPLWLRAQFEPVLGKPLFDRIEGMMGLDDEPNAAGAHVGSSYIDGWYGYASKDLRTILGKRVKGEYSRVYCGRGKRSACRSALERSLAEAIDLAGRPEELYADERCADQGDGGEVECFDSIFFAPVGAVTQPNIPWQNRPTWQQVIEIK